MTAPRALATMGEQFSDTPGLVAALRKLREVRNISYERLDEICGLPKGYSQKLLADPPVKNIGPISTFPLVGGLGAAMVLVDDPEALGRIAGRLVERNKSQVRSGAKHPHVVFKLSRGHFKKLGKLGGIARGKKLSKSARSRIARKAARARWKKRCVAAPEGRNAPISHLPASTVAGS